MSNIIEPKYKDLDIYEMFTEVSVQVKGLKEEVREDYLEDGYSEDDYVVDWYANVEDFDCVDYGFYEFDELMFQSFLKETLNTKAFDKFLVISYEGTWNKATGYKFAEFDKTLYAGYEHTIYHIGQNKGTGRYKNKVNLFKNYHHDRPMGHDWLVIGLTNKQYGELVNGENRTFDDLLEYARPYYEEIQQGLEELSKEVDENENK